MASNPAPPVLFDRARIAARRSSAAQQPDFVTQLVLDELRGRLESVNRRFEKAAIVGPGLSGMSIALPTVDALEIVPTLSGDAHDDMPAFLSEDYDLVASVLDLQAINDVPGTLARIRRHLRPDGLFIAAALGGRSLSELRAAWINADAEVLGGAGVRVAPFMDVRDAGSLLQRAGFALPVSDTDTHRVRYADPLKLMAELKAFGASNPMAEKPGRPVTRRHLAAAIGAYPVDNDGRITATLELIWMSGWAPDESQPKPKQPGSATASLAEALKSKI